MNTPVFDYIVVGAGSAGCVLANRLSASGKHSVLLLEAGPDSKSPWLSIPIGYGKTMFHPTLNWQFQTEPEAQLNQRKIYTPRGRCLGGSSAINGLIYIRGQAEDYDHWAALGNAGWSWQDVLPYFTRSECNTRGASDYHGAAGPLHISDIPDRHELIEAIFDSAQALGIPRNPDFNGPAQEGCGYYQLTTRKGIRSSTAHAFLKPARRRKNLRVETGAQVCNIVLDGKQATGIRYLQQGLEKMASARLEVILSAGALASPQILERSGIGDPAVLRASGIPAIHALPGVGKNLQDHLQFRLAYKVTRPITTNDDLNRLWGKARIGLQWLLRQSGPLAIGINQGGMFARALPDARRPDVQFHFSTLSADMAGARPHPWSGCTLSVCQLRPASRGESHIRSHDPLAAPVIQPNYLSEEIDRETAIAGIRLARQLAATAPLKDYLTGTPVIGPEAGHDDALLAFARQAGATIFHPVGTCKMGRDAQAVVSPSLQVHGIGRLRVADASIMPTLISGNTNAAAIMIAEKAADLILAAA